jgi:large subunit ribosomal protein L24e
MRIEKCYFCSCNVYPGHGSAFVRNDAKMFRFCGSKCRKLFMAKRNPRKIKWTKAYRAAHGKEMTCDPVLEFEKRRNEPVRYNRDLMVKTVQAMKKIDEIKSARQQRHFNRRAAVSNAINKKNAIQELGVHAGLVEDPVIKQFVLKKKAERDEAKRIRQSGGIHKKDLAM